MDGKKDGAVYLDSRSCQMFLMKIFQTTLPWLNLEWPKYLKPCGVHWHNWLAKSSIFPDLNIHTTKTGTSPFSYLCQNWRLAVSSKSYHILRSKDFWGMFQQRFNFYYQRMSNLFLLTSTWKAPKHIVTYPAGCWKQQQDGPRRLFFGATHVTPFLTLGLPGGSSHLGSGS